MVKDQFKQEKNDINEQTKKNELKRIWKEEAAQQKRDNKKKKKVFQKREVDIRFGGVKKDKIQSKVDLESSSSELSDSTLDDFARSRLGLY